MRTTYQNVSRRGFLALAGGTAAMLAACGHAEAPSADTVIPEADGPIYDLEAGHVTLSNGVEMPLTGIGTYDLSDAEAEESVYWTIEAGGRLIDTAAAYNNEAAVGRGIARALADGLATREELFVTTKLWQDGYSEAGVDGALSRLGLDYVDLLFVHQAMGNYQHGYEVVLAAQEAGKTRCVGLSNHTDGQFAEVVTSMGVAPQVAQYESHLHLQRHAAQGFLAQYGTQLEDWFPLGGRGNTVTYLQNPEVLSIAESCGKALPRSSSAGTCKRAASSCPARTTATTSTRTSRSSTSPSRTTRWPACAHSTRTAPTLAWWAA